MLVIASPLPVLLDAYLHDDSFYYLKTAENLAAGRGSTFDGVNHTNGYQPAWFVLLTAMSAAGAGHDAMIPVAIAIQALLFAIGMVLLAFTLVALGVEAVFAAIAVGVVFCALVPVLGWNLLESGLTMLASAAVLRALIGVERHIVGAVGLGLIVSLAALTRLDHLLFVAAAAVWLGWRDWREHGRLVPATLVWFLLPVGVLVGGYLALNLLTTGHIMPVSGLTKSTVIPGWSIGGMVRALFHIDVRQSWKVGLLAAVILVARDIRRREPSGIGVYATVAVSICAYYQLTYPPSLSHAAWYYVPHYILLSYVLAAAFQRASQVLPGSARLAGTAVLIVLMTMMIGARARTMIGYRARGDGERTNTYRVAQTLRAVMAPGDRAAAWDAGILGYFGGEVTNLDGLVNSADYFDRYLSRGRTPDYIREHGFKYIVCVDIDSEAGGRAVAILDDYHEVYRGLSWVILERRPGSAPMRR